MKLKILKKHGEYKRGQVVELTNNVAHGLIEKGIARIFVGYKDVNKIFKKSKAKIK